MAINQEGIMSLQSPAGAQLPQLSYGDSYGAMREALKTARPDADLELEDTLAAIRADLQEVSDEDLVSLTEAIQGLYGDPEGYAKEVADLVASGEIDAEDLPAEYDEEFLSAMLMVLFDEQKARGLAGGGTTEPMEMQLPQGFARGGIAEAARMVAQGGRRGDTMLAHITPSEARLLKSRGGSGTINPATGLPEFFFKKFFKKVGKSFKKLGNSVKKVLSSPLGRILGTIALGAVLGPAGMAFMSGPMAAAVASGTITGLTGGNLKQVLTSAAVGFIGAPGGPVSNFVGKYTGQFITNPLVREAANGAILGTGTSLLQGQSLKQALQSGLTEGAIAGGVALLNGQPPVDASKTASQAASTATTAATIGADLPIAAGTADVTLGEIPSSATVRNTQGNYASVAPDVPMPSSVAPQPAAGIMGTPEAQAAVRNYGQSVGNAVDDAYAAQFNRLNYDQSGNLVGQGRSTPSAGGAYVPGGPGVMESIDTMGGGAKQMMQGDFRAGFDQLSQGASDLFAPGPSRQDILDYAKANNTTFAEASKAISPGMIRSYGPTAVAGIAGLAAAGGFKQNIPGEDEYSRQMRGPIDLSQDPSRYYVQGLPGVQYSQQGTITGSGGWSPSSPMSVNPAVQGRSYINYQPQYMNDGGIAALAKGGYPRKTGQIDGPGTEKSDSIPAMLSDGEFVMTAQAVRGIGNGSRREGARKMYELMHRLEQNASRG